MNGNGGESKRVIVHPICTRLEEVPLWGADQSRLRFFTIVRQPRVYALPGYTYGAPVNDHINPLEYIKIITTCSNLSNFFVFPEITAASADLFGGVFLPFSQCHLEKMRLFVLMFDMA